MTNVTNLNDHRPHVCVHVEDGNVHVMPVSLVKDWANGKYEPDPEVLKAILLEWLSMISED